MPEPENNKSLPPALLVLQQFRAQLTDLNSWMHWYVWILVAYGIAFHLAYPIVMADTDMWFHLSGGRQFWENMQVPVTTAHFSFIEPVREWTNYIWGFQATIFKIYELAGYQGLIIFRALLFGINIVIIYKFLFAHARSKKVAIYLIALLVAYFLLLHARSLQVRPHMISYLFIPVFLYILEYRPRWVFILPPVTVIWANTHGVEYVVGALICGAYTVEALYLRLVKRQRQPEHGLFFYVGIGTCALALLINPHGLSLLSTPFVITDKVAMYVAEMKPVPLHHLYRFHFGGYYLPVSAGLTFIFLFFVFALIRSLFDKRLRISHAILSAGAIVLLSKGHRFVWEFSLLILPLTAAAMRHEFTFTPSRKLFSIRNCLCALILITPATSTYNDLNKYTFYPLEFKVLPVGASNFLSTLKTSGNILSPPLEAAYIRWKLSPGYKIYAYMEAPPFIDMDHFRVNSALRNSAALANFTARYRVDFILINRSKRTSRKTLEKATDYTPVFLDDTQVVYVNKILHPEVAEKFALKYIDPYDPRRGTGTIEERIAELERVIEVFPEGNRAQQAAAWVFFKDKQYERVLVYAENSLRDHPSELNGYYLMGTSLENLDRCDEAIPYFQHALTMADENFGKLLQRHLGTCHYLNKDYPSAYKHLWLGINPFTEEVAPKELYRLAFSSYVVGKTNEAAMLLDMMLYAEKETESDQVFQEAKALQKKIEEQGQADNRGFISWLKQLSGSG